MQQARKVCIQGDVAHVPLTQGYTATVDASDASLVGQWNWQAIVQKRSDGTIRCVYAVRGVRRGPRVYMILMHRVLTDAPDHLGVDHRDGDGLNNRRGNLRLASTAQNQHNQRTNINNTSGHKGVTWNKASQKWQAQIKTGGKQKYLGLFPTVGLAAQAVSAARKELHGEFGRDR